MSAKDHVIVYAYSGSPMWQKIRNVLILKRIQYSIVQVNAMPPRPELRLLGITYRRIPVVAIGNDVYIDTSLIVTELERRFTPDNGHPSLLSSQQGLQEAASMFWNDQNLFPLAAAFIPSRVMTEAFIKDRNEYRPGTDFAGFDKRRPGALSLLRSHLTIIDKQLATSKTSFLLGTSSPSYLDVALFSTLAWAKSLRTADDVLVLPSSAAPSSYRRAMEWYEAVLKKVDEESRIQRPRKLDAASAAQSIFSAPSSSMAGLFLDPTDPIVRAGWLERSSYVSVIPSDTGKVPQYGELVGLTSATVSIQIHQPGTTNKTLVVHFPRIGYSIKKEKKLESHL